MANSIAAKTTNASTWRRFNVVSFGPRVSVFSIGLCLSMPFDLLAQHPAHQKPQNAAEHEPAREAQVKGVVLWPVLIQPCQPSEAEHQESPKEKLPVANQLLRIAAHLAWGVRSHVVGIGLVVHTPVSYTHLTLPT